MTLIKPVYAVITNPVLKSTPTDGYVYTNNVLRTFITILFVLGILFFFYHFILAGYKIIAAQGDAKKYEEGTAALRQSLIGIIVVLMVYGIIQLLAYLFGIDLGTGFTITWPSI